MSGWVAGAVVVGSVVQGSMASNAAGKAANAQVAAAGQASDAQLQATRESIAAQERAFEKTKKVFENVTKVFEIAKRDSIGTHTAADRLAEERLNTIGRLKQKHQGKSSRNFTTLREVNNR